MHHDALHKPPSKSLAAKFEQHENVSHIRKRRIVADDAGKADLLAAFVNAEAKRILQGSSDRLDRNALSPIRMRQKIMHHRNIDPARISADFKLAPRPLQMHQRSDGSRVNRISSRSIWLIFSTRRSWRPPANCAASHWSTMATACSAFRMRAPNVRTFA